MIQVKKRGKEPLRPIIDVALNYPLRLALFPAGDDNEDLLILKRYKDIVIINPRNFEALFAD